MAYKLTCTEALNYCYKVGALNSSDVSSYTYAVMEKKAGFSCAQNIKALAYAYKVGALYQSDVTSYIWHVIEYNKKIRNVSFDIRGLANSYKSGAMYQSDVTSYIWKLIER